MEHQPFVDDLLIGHRHFPSSRISCTKLPDENGMLQCGAPVLSNAKKLGFTNNSNVTMVYNTQIRSYNIL